MQGTVFHGPHDVRVERVDDPALQTPTDALVRISRAGICGSDRTSITALFLTLSPSRSVTASQISFTVHDALASLKDRRKCDK